MTAQPHSAFQKNGVQNPKKTTIATAKFGAIGKLFVTLRRKNRSGQNASFTDIHAQRADTHNSQARSGTYIKDLWKKTWSL